MSDHIRVSRAALIAAIIYHGSQASKGGCVSGCELRLGDSLAEHAIDVAIRHSRQATLDSDGDRLVTVKRNDLDNAVTDLEDAGKVGHALYRLRNALGAVQ